MGERVRQVPHAEQGGDSVLALPLLRHITATRPHSAPPQSAPSPCPSPTPAVTAGRPEPLEVWPRGTRASAKPHG